MNPKLKTILDKATARPWVEPRAYTNSLGQLYRIATYANGRTICEMRGVGTRKLGDVDRANAALITLAANNFAALVEALEFMFESNQDEMRPHGAEGVIVTHEAYMNARAVLSAIEKEID